MSIRVTIWNEFHHEKTNEKAKALYPNGIHGTIKEFLSDCEDMTVTLAALDDPDQGLPEELLNNTDVLIWWGHMAHHEVDDALVRRIRARVLNGMGFIPLHSGHHSKPFREILGTTGNLTWGDDQRCLVWNLCPTHPIAAGVPEHFELFEELYSEPFFVPKPDDLIFGTWYENGNIFRGGMTFTRGVGKIFYFHPGHETLPSFHNPIVQRIIKNAIRWVAPANLAMNVPEGCSHQTEPIFKRDAAN